MHRSAIKKFLDDEDMVGLEGYIEGLENDIRELRKNKMTKIYEDIIKKSLLVRADRVIKFYEKEKELPEEELRPKENQVPKKSEVRKEFTRNQKESEEDDSCFCTVENGKVDLSEFPDEFTLNEFVVYTILYMLVILTVSGAWYVTI